MPLEVLQAPPAFVTPEEHAAAQSSTPASFASLRPPLRFHAQNARLRLEPGLASGSNSAASANGNGTSGSSHAGAPAFEAVGELWVTEQALSFLPASSAGPSSGFTVDYPSISLHAVTRSVPESLQSASGSSSASACLYCQLDDNPLADDEDADDEDGEDAESSIRELWVVVPESNEAGSAGGATPALDELFEALSYCSSLHPSEGAGEDGASGHPFAGIGPFGTGLPGGADVGAGAFEDAAEDAEGAHAANGDVERSQEGAELSETGRRTLAHLESILDWPQEDAAESSAAGSAQRAGASGADNAAAAAVLALRDATQQRLGGGANGAAAPSNTLIFAELPPEFFESPELARALLDLLNAYGRLRSYLPLPPFGRAVVAYEEQEAAARAKEKLDMLLLPFEGEDEEDAGAGETLRVYYGPPSAEIFTGRESASEALGVPITDRNFLISPPGSPPVGWEPVVEDPPNRDTLADDLIRALGQLRDSGANLEDHRPRPLRRDDADEAADDQEEPLKGRASPTGADELPVSRAPKAAPAAPAVIIPAVGEMPGVSVEATDADDGDAGETAITSGGKKYKGVSISSVKATVESMRSGRSRSGSNASLLSVEDAQPGLGGLSSGASAGPCGGKITPTARPPLAPQD